MSTELPLWFGRERGTDLSTLIDWEEQQEAEGGGLVNDFAAGILGLLAPLAIIAMLVGAASPPTIALVALVLAGALWLAAGAVAGCFAAFAPDEAPAWAAAFAQVLVALGKVIAFASLIIVILIGLAILLGVIFGALSSDR